MLEDHSVKINSKTYIDEELEAAIRELYSAGSNIDNSTVNANNTNDNSSVNIDSDEDINVDNTDRIDSIDKVDNNTISVNTDIDRNDKTSVNIDEISDSVDQSSVNINEQTGNIDQTTVNIGTEASDNIDSSPGNIDEPTVNVDKNPNIDTEKLIAILQESVNTLQQQLAVKDKQIDDLILMLKDSQMRQDQLVNALTAAQALHAGTIQDRLTEHSDVTAETAPEEAQESIREPQEHTSFFGRLFRGKK